MGRSRLCPGELICPYVADRCTKAELDALYGDKTAAYAVSQSNGTVWDAAFRRGIGSFANTAPPALCNAVMVDSPGAITPPCLVQYATMPWIESTRPIAGGSEILVDYGAEYIMSDAVPSVTHFGIVPGAIVQ